jgi:hypothetical protein
VKSTEAPIKVATAWDRLLTIATFILEVGRLDDKPTLDDFEAEVETISEWLDEA